MDQTYRIIERYVAFSEVDRNPGLYLEERLRKQIDEMKETVAEDEAIIALNVRPNYDSEIYKIEITIASPAV